MSELTRKGRGGLPMVQFLYGSQPDMSVPKTEWRELQTEGPSRRTILLATCKVVAQMEIAHSKPDRLVPAEPLGSARSLLFLCGFAGLKNAANYAPDSRVQPDVDVELRD